MSLCPLVTPGPLLTSYQLHITMTEVFLLLEVGARSESQLVLSSSVANTSQYTLHTAHQIDKNLQFIKLKPDKL